MPYELPNKVGKITTKAYTEVILQAIVQDLQDQGLTLSQDADPAHLSKSSLAYAEKNNLFMLTLPDVSPDSSVFVLIVFYFDTHSILF